MSSARLAILTPSAFPSVSGNAVTVGRIARGLTARGVDVGIWDLSAVPARAVEADIAGFAPSILHAFHAYHAGPLGLRLARQLQRPLVVTITGTDASGDLLDPDRAPSVRRALDGAAAVTVFHECMVAAVTPALRDGRGRVTVVPQSVVFEGGAPPVARPAAEPGPVVLFPAGIRAVKRPRFPLAPLERLRGGVPGLALLYAGPILEPLEGDALLRALAGRPWARYLGPVPHRAMPELLAHADIVLNCSVSEGGMPNAVLEALALGRAVLASDIDGNRSVVHDGVTGALYASEAEFSARAGRLLEDPALRRRLGEAGRRYVQASFGPERELDGYLTVYRHLVPVPPMP